MCAVFGFQALAPGLLTQHALPGQVEIPCTLACESRNWQHLTARMVGNGFNARGNTDL